MMLAPPAVDGGFVKPQLGPEGTKHAGTRAYKRRCHGEDEQHLARDAGIAADLETGSETFSGPSTAGRKPLPAVSSHQLSPSAPSLMGTELVSWGIWGVSAVRFIWLSYSLIALAA
jgi:hypothetical protein